MRRKIILEQDDTSHVKQSVQLLIQSNTLKLQFELYGSFGTSKQVN